MSTRLAFAAPLPGLADLTEFTLEPVEDAVGLYSLDSADRPEIRFFVLDAATHLPDYAPRFSREQLALVGAAAVQKPTVLAMVNTSDREATVNLLAPVLVNPETGACAQVILEGQDWPLRSPLGATA
ncbi:flagellar assembly protein FliW [Arthrobacter sp. JSM 101049]|uniref:flagellar assembly protein FliW n=1 Tax=Arthrobacter sp. JSM 101049 TaxID=929097 RepID=UPI003567565F